MKNIVRAIPLFLIFMWFAYFSPYFGPENSKKSEAPATKQNSEMNQNSTDMTILPTNGLAKYIGKEFADFEEKFGQPDRIDTTAYGYQSYIYAKDSQKYLQIGVKDQKIVTIYALGTALDVAPFQMNMYLDDLYSIVSVVPEVTFNYHQNSYELELTEEDMNYLPLIRFENESFASLEIDSQTNQVVSIRYFDKETLLRVAPYNVSGADQLKPLSLLSTDDWKNVDEGNQFQTKEILNILRKRAKLQEFTTNEAIDLICKTFHQQVFHEKPTDAEWNVQLQALFKENQLSVRSFSYIEEIIKPDAPSIVDKILRSATYYQQLFDPNVNYIAIHFFEGSVLGLFVQTEQ